METLETLGKYEIKSTLGRGAMGTVYEGWDPIIARRVAIKTVKIPEADDPETEDQLARFRREAQAAGRLIHPNIVGVFDYGETSDIAYIVMEYVDGPSVKSLLDKQERFALPEVLRIMEDLLTGLQFSHERGVVHRDIKPANVMLTSGGQAKIADFGIARIESSSMTQAGTVLGTPAYMSPEQFMGQVVDARSDIYSSGVLLYQLLTGERPFEGGLSAIMHKALNTEPPSPSQIAVTAPVAFDAVVRKAMAKRPEDRFQSATQFLQALRAAAAGERDPSVPDDGDVQTVVMSGGGPARSAAPTPAARPATAPPAPAGRRSMLPMVAGALVLVLLLAGGGAWFLLSGKPAEVARAPTPTEARQTPVPPPALPIRQAENETSRVGGSATPGAERAPAPEPTVRAGTGTPPTPTNGPGQPGLVLPPAVPQPGTPARQADNTPPITAPPPAPPQLAAAPAPANPVIALESLRRDVGRIVANQRCATLADTVQEGGNVTVSGLAGTTAAAAVRQALAGAAIPGGIDWRVTSVDPYYCPALDVVHPITALTGPLAAQVRLSLAGGRTRLRDGEHIQPEIVMPDFRGYLRVDYVAHDGGVVHLYPQIADPAQRTVADPVRMLAAGEPLTLGRGGTGHAVWEVGEPYGTDMIIAIASSQPLFDRPRASNMESESDYLRALQDAVESARQRGTRLAGTAMTVDTVAK